MLGSLGILVYTRCCIIMSGGTKMHLTGIEDHYIIKDNKKLHFGYTTGTCAASASKAAAHMLLTGERVDTVKIQTPKGIMLDLELEDVRITETAVSCAVRKNGGDDPDATHGLLIYARVSKCAEGIHVDGGEGVGRVTKAGMQQAIGEAAINPVPMKMIRQQLEEICTQTGYTGGLEAVIYVPGGKEVAKRTFNPRLGILGGISILGTSGIVEPMSEKALIASIGLEMGTILAKGEQYLLVTPGNYGETFAKNALQLDMRAAMQCSNYVGEMLDMAVNRGVKGVLLISHVGKLIKVAGGIMNTHSRDADCRAELMTAFGLRAGADREQAMRLMESNTTDEALDMLEEMGLRDKAMALVMERVHYYMQHRTAGAIQTEAVMYGGQYGVLGKTDGAENMLDMFRSLSSRQQ